MKKNNKGYMLVEIIVSFVLAFSIAMYLMNLTVRFKDTNEEIYYSTRYLKDKNLITRNIMEELSSGAVTAVNAGKISNNILEFVYLPNYPYNCDVNFSNCNHGVRRLQIENNVLKYGKLKLEGTDYIFDKTHKSYYEKKFEPSLDIGKMEVKNEKGILSIIIPISSKYMDEKIDIKLISKRVYAVDLNVLLDGVSYSKGIANEIYFNMDLNMVSIIDKEDVCAYVPYDSNITLKEIKIKSSNSVITSLFSGEVPPSKVTHDIKIKCGFNTISGSYNFNNCSTSLFDYNTSSEVHLGCKNSVGIY